MWSDTPCKIWTKGKDKDGYPKAWRNGKDVRLTRVILEEILGRPIKPRHLACHHCDTPSCIEPTHLYEGTHGQNQREAWKKGRKQHCTWGRR